MIHVTLLVSMACGFYLPGVAPREFQVGEEVKIKVNKLDSTKTQIPFDYYDMPFCRPTEIKLDAENLGEVLMGDRIENSAYEVHMRNDKVCSLLCKRAYTAREVRKWRMKILEEYTVNMVVDNIPAVTRIPLTTLDGKDTEDVFIKGYILGRVQRIQRNLDRRHRPPRNAPVYINNHIEMKLLYHTPVPSGSTAEEGMSEPPSASRIVGFEIQSASIKHQNVNNLDCQSNDWLELPYVMKKDDRLTIIWTYSVKWLPSEIRWASRWDPYLKMQDSQIHWFSIMNSFMIVLFLTGMVAMILMRALHKDFRRYNADDPEAIEVQQEETGWKLVHGDVFRKPVNPSLFSAIVGTGVQVFAMALLTLVFAALGFLSPANRGALMTTLLLLFVFMGIFGGYYSARTYKSFNEVNWKRNTLLVALGFPGICFVGLLCLNFVIAGEKSSGAIPFGTMFALIVLWIGISVPLVFLGSWIGYRKDSAELPCKVNTIAREIPEQQWYMKKHFSALVGGVLPFGAVFIEVFFIMSSVWLHRFYYMFGFLFIVFIILIITCAEVTIVMAYFQLCSEDYQWWWRGFFTAGSSAVYLFLYSILYFCTKLDITPFSSSVLYFGYMLLASLAFFLLTGTIGHLATFRFVRKIYSSIKID